jgi:hypothetical protein
MNLFSTDFEKIFPKPKKRMLMIIVRARISMAHTHLQFFPKNSILTYMQGFLFNFVTFKM